MRVGLCCASAGLEVRAAGPWAGDSFLPIFSPPFPPGPSGLCSPPFPSVLPLELVFLYPKNCPYRRDPWKVLLLR
ncbi:hypothetical protein VULLAG_LOCUS21528 [Vulpes lagopus]